MDKQAGTLKGVKLWDISCCNMGSKMCSDLLVDLGGAHSGITAVLEAAVGGIGATAGWEAIGRVVHTGQPAGVVIHPTTLQL